MNGYRLISAAMKDHTAPYNTIADKYILNDRYPDPPSHVYPSSETVRVNLHGSLHCLYQPHFIDTKAKIRITSRSNINWNDQTVAEPIICEAAVLENGYFECSGWTINEKIITALLFIGDVHRDYQYHYKIVHINYYCGLEKMRTGNVTFRNSEFWENDQNVCVV